MKVDAGTVHPDRVEDEVTPEDEAGGERYPRMRHFEPVGGPFDDQVPHLGTQSAGHHVDALDRALRPEGLPKACFERAAQDLLREPAEGDEGQDGDQESQDEEDDRALSQRALMTCLLSNLCPVWDEPGGHARAPWKPHPTGRNY